MLIIRLRLTNELSVPISTSRNVHPSALRAAAAPDCGQDVIPRRPRNAAFEMIDWKVEITRVVEDDSEYGRRDATVGPEMESVSSIYPSLNQKAEPLGA